MNYKEEYLNTIFSQDSGPTIMARFKSGREIEYPAHMIKLLETDKNIDMIYDPDTAEILFDTEEW